MSYQSVGMVCNAYKEENALPGLLENASRFFDEIVVVSSPPEGGNNDGTIDIAKKWGVRVEHDTIEEGFGPLRTRCLRYSTCEWVVIMDADERIQWTSREMQCSGTDSWNPETRFAPELEVNHGRVYDQAAVIRRIIETSPVAADYADQVNAIQFSRRHWLDFSGTRPTQNWHMIPDWQLRCVRNLEHIHYTRGMHERIIDGKTGGTPKSKVFDPGQTVGVYFDHYHPWFKAMEMEQRKEDITIYDRLHRMDPGENKEPPPTNFSAL